MKKPFALYFGAIAYYLIICVGLYFFGASMLVSAIMLFGLPAYLLARFSVAPAALLASVAVFGLGVSILLEGIAHIYGLYESAGVLSVRLFGFISLEMMAAIVLQILFLSLLYEMFFDNGVYTLASARKRFISFLVFAFIATLLVMFGYYLFPTIGSLHAYFMLAMVTSLSSIGALFVYRVVTAPLIKRIVCFTTVASIPLFSFLFLSVAYGYKVFNGNYAVTLSLFGMTLPLGALLMVFVVPLCTACIYELYLDDAQ